MMYRSGPRGLA